MRQIEERYVSVLAGNTEDVSWQPGNSCGQRGKNTVGRIIGRTKFGGGRCQTPIAGKATVHLLVAGKDLLYRMEDDAITAEIPAAGMHEVVAMDYVI
jgi:hypothetical protein